jgi:hypothetical protein
MAPNKIQPREHSRGGGIDGVLYNMRECRFCLAEPEWPSLRAVSELEWLQAQSKPELD